jgi:hypothetical protein
MSREITRFAMSFCLVRQCLIVDMSGALQDFEQIWTLVQREVCGAKMCCFRL